ncbi:MAG: lipopolysaccharide biosynthesis protein [Polyangiales bacterium]
MTRDPERWFRPRAGADVTRRALRGGAVSLVAQAVRGVVEGSATLVLARTLLPAQFGLIDMIVSATGIIDLFKDFGLSSATIQRDEINHAQVSLLFWINAGIGFLLMLAIMALAPLLVFVYHRPELLDLALVLSLTTLLGALSVQHMALLRRDLQFGAVAFVDTTAAVVSSGAAVYVAMRGHGPWALVTRQIARYATQTLLSWILCSWRPSRPRRTNVRELLRFGSDVSAAQLVNYLERNVDNVLIARFVGPQALGLYNKAYGLMRIPIDQINALSNIAIPALSRMLGDSERYRQAYRSVASIALLCTVPIAPVSIYAADWFIPALLGEQWRGSVPAFQWLAVSLLVRPLMNSVGWLWMSQGRSREVRRWAMIGGGIAIASFAIGLPWGATGVAMSFAIAEVCVRAPINVYLAGSSGPVRVRDALASALPAWTCALAIALAFPLFSALLGDLGAAPRTLLSALGAMTVGVGVVLATPWSRHMLRDGRAMLRRMRTADA